MTGFFPIMMFALPAAALAIVHTSKAKNRKVIAGIMGSAALVSFVTGVTEPLEFAFVYVAYPLYVIHAILTGTSLALVNALGIKDGFGFSAGAIDYVLNFRIATMPLLLIVIGLGYAVVYYFLFRFVITRWNLRTPGREDDDDDNVELVPSDDKVPTDDAKQEADGVRRRSTRAPRRDDHRGRRLPGHPAGVRGQPGPSGGRRDAHARRPAGAVPGAARPRARTWGRRRPRWTGRRRGSGTPWPAPPRRRPVRPPTSSRSPRRWRPTRRWPTRRGGGSLENRCHARPGGLGRGRAGRGAAARARGHVRRPRDRRAGRAGPDHRRAARPAAAGRPGPGPPVRAGRARPRARRHGAAGPGARAGHRHRRRRTDRPHGDPGALARHPLRGRGRRRRACSSTGTPCWSTGRRAPSCGIPTPTPWRARPRSSLARPVWSTRAAPPTVTRSRCWPTSATRPGPWRPRRPGPRASGCSGPSSASSAAPPRRASPSRSRPTPQVFAAFPGRRVVIRTLDAGRGQAAALRHGRRRAEPGPRRPRACAPRGRTPQVLEDQLEAIAQAAAVVVGGRLGHGADGGDRRRGRRLRRALRRRTACARPGSWSRCPPRRCGPVTCS